MTEIVRGSLLRDPASELFGFCDIGNRAEPTKPPLGGVSHFSEGDKIRAIVYK